MAEAMTICIYGSPIRAGVADLAKTLNRQISGGLRLARAEGTLPSRIFIDVEPSSQGLSRPALGEALEYAAEGHLRVLVVRSIRHLGRPPTVAAKIVSMFEDRGVAVRSYVRDEGKAAAHAIEEADLEALRAELQAGAARKVAKRSRRSGTSGGLHGER